MATSKNISPNAVLTGGLTALSVNVNKVALLRNTRALGIPSVLRAAQLCLMAGASGITVHPRPDERHIRRHDVHELAAMVGDWPGREFNIEGNPFHNLMEFVRELKPDQATLVPDSADQSTSDHGWSFPADAERLRPIIDECHALGVRVSLFMDPVPQAMAAVAELGADRVEIYTETYARAWPGLHKKEALQAFVETAQAAALCGLGVNAGHDLNQANLACFLAAVPGVLEVSIGHALVADALESGLPATVRAYQRCLRAVAGAGAAAASQPLHPALGLPRAALRRRPAPAGCRRRFFRGGAGRWLGSAAPAAHRRLCPRLRRQRAARRLP
jgi:pyridoxine 5-phosphate synthase